MKQGSKLQGSIKLCENVIRYPIAAIHIYTEFRFYMQALKCNRGRSSLSLVDKIKNDHIAEYTLDSQWCAALIRGTEQPFSGPPNFP